MLGTRHVLPQYGSTPPSLPAMQNGAFAMQPMVFPQISPQQAQGLLGNMGGLGLLSLLNPQQPSMVSDDPANGGIAGMGMKKAMDYGDPSSHLSPHVGLLQHFARIFGG